MTNEQARNRGLRLAAKLTGIGGIAIAAIAFAEARATAAATSETPHEAMGESALRARTGGCGCSPCWGPPAPPERGAVS